MDVRAGCGVVAEHGCGCKRKDKIVRTASQCGCVCCCHLSLCYPCHCVVVRAAVVVDNDDDDVLVNQLRVVYC